MILFFSWGAGNNFVRVTLTFSLPPPLTIPLTSKPPLAQDPVPEIPLETPQFPKYPKFREHIMPSGAPHCVLVPLFFGHTPFRPTFFSAGQKTTVLKKAKWPPFSKITPIILPIESGRFAGFFQNACLGKPGILRGFLGQYSPNRQVPCRYRSFPFWWLTSRWID